MVIDMLWISSVCSAFFQSTTTLTAGIVLHRLRTSIISYSEIIHWFTWKCGWLSVLIPISIGSHFVQYSNTNTENTGIMNDTTFTEYHQYPNDNMNGEFKHFVDDIEPLRFRGTTNGNVVFVFYDRKMETFQCWSCYIDSYFHFFQITNSIFVDILVLFVMMEIRYYPYYAVCTPIWKLIFWFFDQNGFSLTLTLAVSDIF